MGCSCGKGNSAKAQDWVFTGPDGKKTTYRSEVQARAAQIRAKGGTYVAVAR